MITMIVVVEEEEAWFYQKEIYFLFHYFPSSVIAEKYMIEHW